MERRVKVSMVRRTEESILERGEGKEWRREERMEDRSGEKRRKERRNNQCVP